MLRVALCGGVTVEASGRRLPDALLAGRQGRLVLAYLVCERHRSVPREELAELLWGEHPPASWPASLSAVVSKLRRLLTEADLDGPASLPSAFGSYRLHLPQDVWVDWEAVHAHLTDAEAAAAVGDAAGATAAAAAAETIARRGFLTDDCHWVDEQRERLHDVLVRAVQARAEAHLLTAERARAVDAAREALGLDPVRESGYRLLMRALAAAGERGEALRVWEQCRSTLVEELGTDPSPETEAVYLDILREETAPASLPSGVVTFLLTDIVGSSGLWERHPTAMAEALARHDALVAEVARAHGGQLLKAKLEGDATVSVFGRATSGALAALALRQALEAEPWPEDAAPQVRMALHTGEAFEREGDFFGPALNRAARLRSLAAANQILVSQALAELVRDHLPADTELRSLGQRELRGLSRGEHVFELAPAGSPVSASTAPAPLPLELPPVPAPLVPSGPFVGRKPELDRLIAEWELAIGGSPRAVVIGGEPGVGKTRLAAERAELVHDNGGLVLYGRCDEDLGAPYQPFAEAFRTVLRSLGAERLASVRGIEEIARLVPEVADVVPDLGPPTRTDPDTERYVLFDAVARLLVSVSAEVPVLLVLDDLHWATKPTLLMLRHILRNAEHARLQVLATYRTTDLDPAHPLAATLADLHRDGTATRLVLSGLGEHEVTAYLGAAGYEDDDLAVTLTSVTSGNPFFLLEVLRHLEETGGRWDPTTLPQGVREAVGRRLSRLSPQANEALLAGAVVGGRFALDLVERVVGRDLVDDVGEACAAELVVEEHGGWFRFNHDIVRRSLLAGVASVKRVRLHQRIAEHLEATAADDDTAVVADLAHHYFESAWAGNAAKAVEYCRRAADQAMEGLAYEGAADLYDRAVQAMEIDDRPVGDSERAELLLARCEALLAAGDVTPATEAVARLEEAAVGSARLAAWATCFAGQLAVLIHPDQLDTIEGAVAAAAEQLAELEDAAGEAKAHTVRASCLARLGRHADCETALDRALTAARRGDDHRRVNAVLAGAPLAALWGPNPVPRAGGRCLDVIRLLRITTGSPAVEATSTRCQAVLEAFRGRAHAARRMLENARQTLTELGLRHALLEVDLFAGIVELVDGEAAAAEVPLRRAYGGFRRMGVDADAAQAASLLARASVELGRDGEADELCADSERLGGNDLKASIAWRAVRAQLLSRQGEHAKARDLAEAAVALAEHTDALVDHGDACMALASVLDAAGDRAGARRAADAAAALYERKGAGALVERARGLLVGAATFPLREVPQVDAGRAVADNQATRRHRAMLTCFAARDWEGLRSLTPTPVTLEDRRAVVGRSTSTVDNVEVFQGMADLQMTHVDYGVVATRGDRLALSMWVNRGHEGLEVGALVVGGVDEEGVPQFSDLFDPDELDAAYAELDARYLAGEAAPHADVWRTIVEAYAGLSRRELPPRPDDFVSVDHRRASLAPGELPAAVEALFELVPDVRWRILAVHALDAHGAVIHVEYGGTSSSGTEGRWRAFDVIAVRDVIHRVEIFSEEALDAALARFGELRQSNPTPSLLENACTRAMRRFSDRYARRDWEALEAWPCAPDFFLEWRGKLAMYGQRVQGLEGVIALLRAWADVGRAPLAQTPIAVRGGRLALFRAYSIEESTQAHNDSLYVVGLDSDGAAEFLIGFDPEQLDEAFEELDARYIEGEAAPYAEVWRQIAGAAAATNSRNLAALPEGPVVDQNRQWFPVVETTASLESMLDLIPDLRVQHLAVHRLERRGAVVSSLVEGSTDDGVRAEWLIRLVFSVDEGIETEAFRDDQLDAALARFEELSRAPATNPLLQNAATRAMEGFSDAYERRDWTAIEEWAVAPGFSFEWRGKLALHGPRLLDHDGASAVLRAWASTRTATLEYTPIAVRGDRLALLRLDSVDEATQTGERVLVVIGVAGDGAAEFQIGFDPDQLDEAYAELDDRYLAGEAAPYADVWRRIVAGVAATNSHNPAALPDALVDHTRQFPFGEAPTSLAELLDLVPDLRLQHIAVHRLDRHGAVVSSVAGGSTAEGSLAEWSVVAVVSVGEHIQSETFAEDQLEAALARFDELRPSERTLENAATRAEDLGQQLLLRRDWTALADLIAEDAVREYRRSGIQHRLSGREQVMADSRAVADVATTFFESRVVAVRGDLLALTYTRGGGSGPGAFEDEVVQVTELDSDGRVACHIVFDADALDAAYQELDRRYLAGEAAPHADSWQTIVGHIEAINRRDLSALPTATIVDHSRQWLPTGDPPANLLPLYDLLPDLRVRCPAIYRLDDHGAVTQWSVEGTTEDDVHAAWSVVTVIMSDTHAEIFSDDQLDAALARFEELRPQRQVDNLAARTNADAARAFNARDRDWMKRLYREDIVHEDRRKGFSSVVSGGDAVLQEITTIWSLGSPHVEPPATVALRGERLGLFTYATHPDRSAFHLELLQLIEVDDEGRTTWVGWYDPNDPGDVDAAFAELDRRYLEGEAAPFADMWRNILEGVEAINRRDMSAIPSGTLVDHSKQWLPSGDAASTVRPLLELVPDLRMRCTAIYRLDRHGAVAHWSFDGTTEDGASAAWSYVSVITPQSHAEIFPDDQLEDALARFEELQRRTGLENAATRAFLRGQRLLASEDFTGLSDFLAEDMVIEDRRRGLVHHGDGQRDLVEAVSMGAAVADSRVVATRGERLALVWMDGEYVAHAYGDEFFMVIEVDPGGRPLRTVIFDASDLDGAYAELDARYLQGDAAAHADVWRLMVQRCEALNRHEFPTPTGFVTVDHRPASLAPGQLTADMNELFKLVPDIRFSVSAVHRLAHHGFVVTFVFEGTTPEGFAARWSVVNVYTVSSSSSEIDRVEIFPLERMDAAFARHEELRPTPGLENAASRALVRGGELLVQQDFGALGQFMTDDSVIEDRRKGLAHERSGRRQMDDYNRLIADMGLARIETRVLATRGERLALARVLGAYGPTDFDVELLQLMEVDDDGRLMRGVLFDSDDEDAAWEELDERYLAGEAAPYADTWRWKLSVNASVNRGEAPELPDGYTMVDRRAGGLALPAHSPVDSLRAHLDLVPDHRIRITVVHRLDRHGAVVSQVGGGTSVDGLAASWTMIEVITPGSGVELFSEDQLDDAIRRFEELAAAPSQLENAASRANARGQELLAPGDPFDA